MADADLGCAQGDSYSFNILVANNADGSTPNLLNADIVWSLFDGDYQGATRRLQKTGTASVVTVDGHTRANIAVDLLHADTVSLPVGSLYHECKVVLADSRTKHIETGRFVVRHSGTP